MHVCVYVVMVCIRMCVRVCVAMGECAILTLCRSFVAYSFDRVRAFCTGCNAVRRVSDKERGGVYTYVCSKVCSASPELVFPLPACSVRVC